MTLRYTVVFDRERDGRIIASVPGIPGCHVYGRTRRQAVARARAALQLYIEVLRQKGRRPRRQPTVTALIEVAA